MRQHIGDERGCDATGEIAKCEIFVLIKFTVCFPRGFFEKINHCLIVF